MAATGALGDACVLQPHIILMCSVPWSRSNLPQQQGGVNTSGRWLSGLRLAGAILHAGIHVPSATSACLSSPQAGSASGAEAESLSRAQAGRLSQCSSIHKEHRVTAVGTCAPGIPLATVITGPVMQQPCSNDSTKQCNPSI